MADSSHDDLIRQHTEMFAELLRLAAAANSEDDDDVDMGDVPEVLHQDDELDDIDSALAANSTLPVLRSAYSTSSSQEISSLTPEQKKECLELASKLDMIATGINEKYVNIAQQKLKSASSYADFESAISEALRSDPNANQVVLLYQLTREAARVSWTSARNLFSWAKQFFQQRIAEQIVQDNKSLKSCVEEAASTLSQPKSSGTG